MGRSLIRDIGEALAKYDIAPDSIEFDVRETTLSGLTPAQTAALDALCNLGVRIAIDDFGSELSSLGYVQKFHIAHLKIGRAIVQTAGNDVGRAAAVRAIVDFASDLGVGVVAERRNQGSARNAACARAARDGPGLPLQQGTGRRGRDRRLARQGRDLHRPRDGTRNPRRIECTMTG